MAPHNAWRRRRHAQMPLQTCHQKLEMTTQSLNIVITNTQISGSEVIGAQHEGSDAFRVWYCPVRNPGAAKQTRQLRQSGVYHCHSITEARAFVHAVRLRAAPRVAKRPRAVVIILNPVSGRGT